ncbi:MAG: hypothetical protein J5580_01685 [Clostridia bacterium]|nr:hypothetical protein [Clostridia bacterium]
MKKDKELNLKVVFANEPDINVLDESFYKAILDNIIEIKNKEEKDNKNNEQQDKQ